VYTYESSCSVGFSNESGLTVEWLLLGVSSQIICRAPPGRIQLFRKLDDEVMSPALSIASTRVNPVLRCCARMQMLTSDETALQVKWLSAIATDIILIQR